MKRMEYVAHRRHLMVFNQAIAGELMKRGFVLEKIDKNLKFPDKNTFFFSNSENIVEIYNEVASGMK